MKSLLTALAAALAAALGQAQVAIHVDEDFDAGIPPSWTVVDVTCPATNWHATSGGYKGNFLDGTEFAFIDSDAPGQFCWVEDYLVSPSFDASGAAALRIAFDHYFRFWSNGAGTLQVFDGAAWVDVITYKSTLGAWGAPDHVDLDLSAWANTALAVRFKYTGNWDWWWALDNVLVYEPQPQTLVYCTAKVNSKGCLPAIAFSGTPSASLAQPFTISASKVINNKAGLFIYSLSGRDNLPFQGGILCLQQPIRRTTPQVSAGNPPPDDCSGSYAIDFNAWIQSGIDPLLVPGRMVDGQYWSRDPASPSGTGLSDAVEFVIGL